MRKIGIYRIANLKNGKVYYGSSNNVMNRLRVHKSRLKKGTHPNPHLQSSWNKYGQDSFTFQLIEETSIEQLQVVEQSYLDWCKIFPFWSYNIGYDAHCATRGLRFGPPSAEHRLKISLANSGSNSVNFGKKLSKETRQKMSLAKKGVPKPLRTEEHKRKLGLANRKGKDKLIYTFYHPVIGIEKSLRYEFVSKYKLSHTGVGLIIQKRRKSYKGWRLHES